MARTRQKIECSSIPPVINKYTARVYTWRSCVLQRALKRLELLDAKVSRAVLRGRDGGNIILLPDTDIQDAGWIADLLQHGLFTASFVPSQEQQDLRDLTRLRVSLVQERTRLANRVHKVLDAAGCQLSAVLSDILGLSGKRILQALCAGESDPVRLAKLMHPGVKATEEQVIAALTLPLFSEDTVGKPLASEINGSSGSKARNPRLGCLFAFQKRIQVAQIDGSSGKEMS